jgi:hypothetical protein
MQAPDAGCSSPGSANYAARFQAHTAQLSTIGKQALRKATSWPAAAFHSHPAAILQLPCRRTAGAATHRALLHRWLLCDDLVQAARGMLRAFVAGVAVVHGGKLGGGGGEWCAHWWGWVGGRGGDPRARQALWEGPMFKMQDACHYRGKMRRQCSWKGPPGCGGHPASSRCPPPQPVDAHLAWRAAAAAR